jgi:hypothetical protein
VAIPTPEHYLEQAEALLSLYSGRKARQTELRRAVSAAYYAVFHFTLAQAADLHVGVVYRATPRYTLVYRSIAHARLRDVCVEVTKTTQSAAMRASLSGVLFGTELRKFSRFTIDLQEERHAADYDPGAVLSKGRALSAIAAARSAGDAFLAASLAEREIFLTLLLCSPRRA